MKIITRKLLRNVTLKDCRSFTKGESFTIAFLQSEKKTDYMVVTRVSDGQSYKTRQYNSFFKKPTLKQLENWSNDGVCETVTGERTEPDGHGPDGSPSWMLAMGLI